MNEEVLIETEHKNESADVPLGRQALSYLELVIFLFLIPFTFNLLFIFFPYNWRFPAEHHHNGTKPEISMEFGDMNMIMKNANNDTTDIFESFFSESFIHTIYYSFALFVWMVLFDVVVPGVHWLVFTTLFLVAFVLICFSNLIFMYVPYFHDTGRRMNYGIQGAIGTFLSCSFVLMVGLALCCCSLVQKHPKNCDDRKRWSRGLARCFTFQCCHKKKKPKLKSDENNAIQEQDENIKENTNLLKSVDLKESEIEAVLIRTTRSTLEMKIVEFFTTNWIKRVKDNFKVASIPFFRSWSLVLYHLLCFCLWYSMMMFGIFWIKMLSESNYSVTLIIVFHVSEIIMEHLYAVFMFIFFPQSIVPELRNLQAFVITYFFGFFHRFLFVEVTNLPQFFFMSVIWFVYFGMKYLFRSTKFYFKIEKFLRTKILKLICYNKLYPDKYMKHLVHFTYEEWIEDLSIDYFFEVSAKYVSIIFFLVLIPIFRYLPYNMEYFPTFHEMSDEQYNWCMIQMGFLFYVEFITDLAFQFIMYRITKKWTFNLGKSLTFDNYYHAFLYMCFVAHFFHDITITIHAPEFKFNPGWF